MDAPAHRPPDRTRTVDSAGVRIAVHEWGDEGARPVLLSHGGFDFARTYDCFAPLLADAGFRVVAWDQRGHGDSDHAALYSWDADIRDATSVLDSIGQEPIAIVGHSKGGGLMLRLAAAWPHRVRALANLDGIPSRRPAPDVADRERTRMFAGELTSWLDHRRRMHTNQRKPGTLEELAARRAKMNPRLPEGWLRHLVTVGAYESDDGWRWKVDPSMRFGGFGPWRSHWALRDLPGLGMPFIAVLGREQEPMGWGTRPEDVYRWLPPGGRLEILDGVGHFVHIEQPRLVADLVLDVIA